jgi:hypothetical protein
MASLRTLFTNMKKELRKNPLLDLSLAGYDYSVNGNQKALNGILGKPVFIWKANSFSRFIHVTNQVTPVKHLSVLLMPFRAESQMNRRAFD